MTVSTRNIVTALKANRGLIKPAAEFLGCSRETIYSAARKSPTVRQAIEDARENLKDVAEDKLFQRVEKDEWDAVKFFLTTQAKDRGYAERKEITGAGGSNFMTLGDVPDAKLGDYITNLAKSALSFTSEETDGGDGSTDQTGRGE